MIGKRRCLLHPPTAYNYMGENMQMRISRHRREEVEITLCWVGELKQRYGDRQRLLMLPHSRGPLFDLLGKNQHKSCPSVSCFPRRTLLGQFVGGVSPRPRLGPICSATWLAPDDRVHFEKKFFRCLLELIFERWSTWCLLLGAGWGPEGDSGMNSLWITSPLLWLGAFAML